jgi:hypothetical protein
MKTKLLTIAILFFSPFLIKGQPVDLHLNTPGTGTQAHYASNSITFKGIASFDEKNKIQLITINQTLS